MIKLYGDLDALLPIKTDSDVHTALVVASDKSRSQPHYVVGDGSHVDGLVDMQLTVLRPCCRAAVLPCCRAAVLPCCREAFLRLTAWVTTGKTPPASQVLTRPASGDLTNTWLRLAATTTKR